MLKYKWILSEYVREKKSNSSEETEENLCLQIHTVQ